MIKFDAIAVPETSVRWRRIGCLEAEKQTLRQHEWLFSGDGSCVINDHMELKLRQDEEARNQELERRWEKWAAQVLPSLSSGGSGPSDF